MSHSGPSGRRPRSWHHHRRTRDSPSSGDLSQGLTRGGEVIEVRGSLRLSWEDCGGAQEGRALKEEPQV